MRQPIYATTPRTRARGTLGLARIVATLIAVMATLSLVFIWLHSSGPIVDDGEGALFSDDDAASLGGRLEDVELVVRTSSSMLSDRLMGYFLPSLWIFHPTREPPVLVLDQESAKDRRLGTVLSRLPSAVRPSVAFESIPDSLVSAFKPLENPNVGGLGALLRRTGGGYLRQQYFYFIADQYSSKRFVALCDDDVLFHGYLSREDVFFRDGDKPIWIGLNDTRAMTPSWVHGGSEYFIGKPVVANFMRGFPLIVRRDHLEAFRHHVLQRTGETSFDGAFRTFLRSCPRRSICFSQFVLIGNFLWHHFHDEYHWVIESDSERSPPWQPSIHKPRMVSHTAYDIMFASLCDELSGASAQHIPQECTQQKEYVQELTREYVQRGSTYEGNKPCAWSSTQAFQNTRENHLARVANTATPQRPP